MVHRSHAREDSGNGISETFHFLLLFYRQRHEPCDQFLIIYDASRVRMTSSIRQIAFVRREDQLGLLISHEV